MPRRPPKKWWDHCIKSVRARGAARDPKAVCGADWWKLPESRRRAIVRDLERSKNPRHKRSALALALAERSHQEHATAARLGAAHTEIRKLRRELADAKRKRNPKPSRAPAAARGDASKKKPKTSTTTTTSSTTKTTTQKSNPKRKKKKGRKK